MDTYTRVVLTVIAAALVVIAARGLSPVSVAQAAEDIACTFSNGVTVSDFRDSIDVELDTVSVKVEQGFNQPGSSSSTPLYVKSVN